MEKHTIHECELIELRRHPSERLGSLSVVESGVTRPFPVKRVCYIYDVPGGASRGGHAHHAVSEFIVAAAGSFSVTVDDGQLRKTVTLNRPYFGLLVRPGVWVTLEDFSSGAIALVMTSDHFSHEDHIKSYSEFLELTQSSEK